MRKAWDELSPGYRARLERSGFTRADFDAGASRQAARGHGKTPERPERAAQKPERYRDYVAARAELEERVIERKRQVWGSGDHWRWDRSEKNVHRNPITRRPPDMTTLRKFLAMTNDQLVALAARVGAIRAEGMEEWGFLFYHST